MLNLTTCSAVAALIMASTWTRSTDHQASPVAIPTAIPIPVECECMFGYYYEVPNGSTNYWNFVPGQPTDGTCTEPTPPCVGLTGCHLDYVVSYMNNSSATLDVTVTFPGGATVGDIVLANTQWDLKISKSVDCGESITISVKEDETDQGSAQLICTSCSYQ